ncbi:hypothetical protein Taro_032949 [Colocasia esculenta]|uniref:Uncharacterized protein n=1 Tax=Colocasia esculenta TaxID=4460 RepID=A0A843VYQ4_COLES|nr:hypothetical protein [Colocasia esculenta]
MFKCFTALLITTVVHCVYRLWGSCPTEPVTCEAHPFFFQDNKEEEVDPNALDDQVVEREVEFDEEEEWTDDGDKEDDEDDAKLDIS